MLTGTFSLLAGAGAMATVAYSLWIGSQSEPIIDGSQLPTREEMRRFVLWRSFYVNPADPRGWVPKISGFGWTVNLRTQRNAAVFAALIVATFLAALGAVVAALLSI